MPRSTRARMLADLTRSYAYYPKSSAEERWWWETYYRGRIYPYHWSAEIARETMVRP